MAGLIIGEKSAQSQQFTEKGKIIRLRGKEISVIGRNTQGVRLIDLEATERVMALARLAESDEEQEEEGLVEEIPEGAPGEEGKEERP